MTRRCLTTMPDVCVDACSNVYSMTYAQNQGSFLAGVYAAAITTSMMEGTNDAPDHRLGRRATDSGH